VAHDDGALDGAVLGEAVQVEPIRSTLKLPGTKRLKLKWDIILSTSAFKFTLRRYISGLTPKKIQYIPAPIEAHILHTLKVGRCRLNPSNHMLKPPGSNLWKLKCDTLVPISAFKFNLRRYIKGAPQPSAFFSAHFVFVRSAWLRDVPYDPQMYFDGEEDSLALRSWTNGWGPADCITQIFP
jgi:hypothetical protein